MVQRRQKRKSRGVGVHRVIYIHYIIIFHSVYPTCDNTPDNPDKTTQQSPICSRIFAFFSQSNHIKSTMDTATFETLQWQVLDAYFQHHGHAHHQLHGWEHFLKTILHEIVREHGTVHVTVGDERKQKHTVSFLELRVWPPSVRESTGEVRPVTPNECLLRGLTMKNNITCNMLHEVVFYDADGEVDASKPTLCRRYHDLSVCEIPAMVGIRYDDDKAPHKQQCLFDDGGYFIIGGQERSLTSQLKLRVNTLYIFEGKALGKFSYVAEIRSLHSTKYRSTSTLRVGVVQKKDEATNIVCIVPFLKKSSTTPLEIGLAGMFTLLGVHRAEALAMMALPTPACQALAERALDACIFKSMTRAEILVWVGKHGTTETTREKQARYTFHIFQNETLPHIGMDEKIETLRAKAFFLAKMVRDLVSVHFGLRAPTCRDHNRNKKLDGPGPLMAVLFRQIYRNFMKTFQQAFTKALESKKTLVCAKDFINPSRITGNLTYHFATGNWSLQKGLNMFVQNLNRVCRVATYSQMRRVNTPMNKDGGKSTAPRQLPMSDWGIFCPVETPEGPTVGMTKNLALTTHVSNTTLDAALLEPRVLEWLGLTPFTPATRDSVVYLNGKMVGTTKDVEATRRQAVLMRRTQDGLPFDCSIYVEDRDLFMYTTVGRMVRPVFVLENLHRAAAIVQQSSGDLFAELLFAGVLEYLDKAEEEYLYVATTLEQAQTSPQDYTHVEIHGICTLGFAAALIPFAGNNQAPRLTFQAAQCKQVIGAAPLNLSDRMDLHAFYQETPQRPLVHTRVEQLRHQSALPSGMSCIVAVLSLSGFNQEDSILVKKQFAERGGGVKTYYHTFTAECSTKNDETFERPNLQEVVPRAKTNYQSIDEDGFPPVGSTVKAGDVIIGKTFETMEIDSTGKQTRKKKDKSVVLRQGEGGVVDKVMLTSSTNGTLLARVRLRERSGPEVGDKFSSRHGQKVRFLCFSTQCMATLINRLPQFFFSGHNWLHCQRREPAIHFSRYLPRHSHQQFGPPLPHDHGPIN